MRLSDREWTVLSALWETGGAELGTLVSYLHPQTAWSRNTVLTYLTRMEAKQLVRIDKDASPHMYYATLDRESCRQLLVLKSIFRDKLPPKWQFAIWSVLGLVLIVPAGTGGRHVLFNWPLVVEILRSSLAGDFQVTCVRFPFPVLKPELPQTFWDWIFVAYVLGIMKFTLKSANIKSSEIP